MRALTLALNELAILLRCAAYNAKRLVWLVATAHRDGRGEGQGTPADPETGFCRTPSVDGSPQPQTRAPSPHLNCESSMNVRSA